MDCGEAGRGSRGGYCGGGRDLGSQHEGVVEHADCLSPAAGAADCGVAAAAEVGCDMTCALFGISLRVVILAALVLLAPQVHGAVYYVVVAGLGGEPDYE